MSEKHVTCDTGDGSERNPCMQLTYQIIKTVPVAHRIDPVAYLKGSDPNVLRNRAMTNYSFYLNRYKFLVPFDIPYYSAFIASIFEQRVFKVTYEEPQNARYIIFSCGSVTKNGPPVK